MIARSTGPAFHVVAIGGAGTTNGYGDRPAGARVTADLPVTADQRLYVEVGGNGTSGGVHPAGGFNGGAMAAPPAAAAGAAPLTSASWRRRRAALWNRGCSSRGAQVATPV